MFGRKLLFLVLISCALSADNVDWTDQANWGDDCPDTARQSPIDIETKQVMFCPIDHWVHFEAPCEQFPYMEEGQSLTSQAMDVNYLTYSVIDWNMSTTYISIFNALQVHYHAPSEHTINGKSFDLQMHLVHTYWNRTGQFLPNDTANMTYQERREGEDLAVIGVLFYENDEIEEDVFDTFLPDNMTNMTNFRAAFECIAERFFYHYKGSLTTPPCTENVQWFVLRDPLPIRPENLKRFTDKLNDGNPNNRVAQDLSGRDVYLLNEGYCQDYLKEKFHDFMGMDMEDMHMDMDDLEDMDSDSSMMP